MINLHPHPAKLTSVDTCNHEYGQIKLTPNGYEFEPIVGKLMKQKSFVDLLRYSLDNRSCTELRTHKPFLEDLPKPASGDRIYRLLSYNGGAELYVKVVCSKGGQFFYHIETLPTISESNGLEVITHITWRGVHTEKPSYI